MPRPRPQLGALVLFPVNPDNRTVIRRYVATVPPPCKFSFIKKNLHLNLKHNQLHLSSLGKIHTFAGLYNHTFHPFHLTAMVTDKTYQENHL